jgi:hypothetical protein
MTRQELLLDLLREPVKVSDHNLAFARAAWEGLDHGQDDAEILCVLRSHFYAPLRRLGAAQVVIAGYLTHIVAPMLAEIEGRET